MDGSGDGLGVGVLACCVVGSGVGSGDGLGGLCARWFGVVCGGEGGERLGVVLGGRVGWLGKLKN